MTENNHLLLLGHWDEIKKLYYREMNDNPNKFHLCQSVLRPKAHTWKRVDIELIDGGQLCVSDLSNILSHWTWGIHVILLMEKQWSQMPSKSNPENNSHLFLPFQLQLPQGVNDTAVWHHSDHSNSKSLHHDGHWLFVLLGFLMVPPIHQLHFW